MKLFRSLVVLALFASPAAAQISRMGIEIWSLRSYYEARKNGGVVDLRTLPTSGTVSRSFTPDPLGGPASPLGLDDSDADLLGALVRESTPALDREALEGDIEENVPFHTVPGGIVLGRTARPVGEPSMRTAMSGATLHRTTDGGLALRSVEGTDYALQAVEPSFLRACLAFVANPRQTDAVIDILSSRVALAPEFAGTPLAKVLEEADRAPRTAVPDLGATKSVIVDREVRFGVDPQTKRVDLFADLELRFYAPQDSLLVKNAVRRIATWPFYDGARGLEPTSPLPAEVDRARLMPRLEEVAEIAAWIGFLRWLQETDAAGFARLAGELAPSAVKPPAPAKR